jgi:pyruvate/2-oxoglutarate dehydrogenase complex dihydrolipoamide dehydrogenase (E3) component
VHGKVHGTEITRGSSLLLLFVAATDCAIYSDLIVVGSGVIAMEYASMFNALPTCRVTVIDERPTFLDFVGN